jgi:hypothetical protein
VPRAALEQMRYLLDQAFAGDDWHSLVGNLSGVTADDWVWATSASRRGSVFHVQLTLREAASPGPSAT